MGLKAELCQIYTAAGVAHFIHMALDLGNWFHTQLRLVQCFLMFIYFLILCPLYALEWMVWVELFSGSSVAPMD
jgi:hypothetical protein